MTGIAIDIDIHRKRLIGKVLDATLRTRGAKDCVVANAVVEALRNAWEVAAWERHQRGEAIGFCDGMRRSLQSVRTLTTVEPYTRALELASCLLDTDNSRVMESHYKNLCDVVTDLTKVARAA